jgi:hypothetical protein
MRFVKEPLYALETSSAVVVLAVRGDVIGAVIVRCSYIVAGLTGPRCSDVLYVRAQALLL